MNKAVKKMKLKNADIILLAVSMEPSIQETDDYLKMKLRDDWKETTLSRQLIGLENEGLVVQTDEGYRVIKDGKAKIANIEEQFGRKQR